MRKVILLLLVFPCSAFGQISDDFENGSLSLWTEEMSDHWRADAEGSLNGNYSLHHIFDNPSSGSDCIGLPLTDFHPSEGTARWTFLIRHGCDPSSSNSWAVWLMSDAGPASFGTGAEASGFAVGVNMSGYDDTLRLWKIRKGSVSSLAACPVNWQNDIGTSAPAKIVVERRAAGSWSLSVYDSENNLRGSSSSHDTELFIPEWLIVNYRYTSTRDRLLWLDDLKIEGVFYEDRIPPSVTGCKAEGKSSLEVNFSEDPSDGILDPAVFKLSTSDNAAREVSRKSPGFIIVNFENDFINKTSNRLLITVLCDRAGNCTSNAEAEFTPVWAEAGDVIISEIMADPFPVVSLPGKEYLELFNTTGFSYRIGNWKLMTENSEALLPETEIFPGEYIILCSPADTILFSAYGRTAGVKSFPALTDDGRVICICDPAGTFIHGLEYSSSWYGEKLKSEGGWSFEMIDASFPFYTAGNWEASSSKRGGTPGYANSAARNNPDPHFHGIENVFPTDSVTVNLVLSESVEDLSRFPEKIVIDGLAVKSVQNSDLLQKKYVIHLSQPQLKNIVYSLFITGGMNDFAGNEITRRSFSFGMAEPPERGDIVFNEILFNPFPDDPDYVELFNNSEKIIDASALYVASVNTETGATSGLNPVSGEGRCILPNSFYVATTDRNMIIERYPYSDPLSIFNTPSLPSMPDNKGHLLLLNRQLDMIDEVIYSENMHFSLLAGSEGISLEKIRPEAPSWESMNWHSASESSGWGSPGKENSVYTAGFSSGERIKFSSGRISPDNDGYEDVLVIDIDPEGTDNVVTISVFGETGNFIRRVAANYFVGEQGSLVWDATAGDGSLVESGIYIILTELYNTRGKTGSWKRVCTVVR